VVTSLPSSGTLSQLSQVFSNYGYEPKNGMVIQAVPTNVTGSNNRVYYARPSPDQAGINKVHNAHEIVHYIEIDFYYMSY
jgi:hypothetical protein